MPYTPPSHRSPASSKTSSPILSRTHSYVDTHSVSPASSQRPLLPRSLSSTAYLNKPHRRTPSVSTADNTAANSHATVGEPVDAAASDANRSNASPSNGTVRQSPSPVNDLLIPSGAITTPPDSSDDEERGRKIGNLRELQEALSSIDVKRVPSPVRDVATIAPLDASRPKTAARSLSAEARRIAHSRSSSDIMLSQHYIHPINTDPVIMSSEGSDAEGDNDDDEDDDELRIKPPLLRKKSGELVKPALRPSSRRRPSSMPGTPTYSKAVHFNEDIEQVRHFLQVDRPIAVSAGSSPVETYDSETEYPFELPKPKTPEWEIKLTNFPKTESYERQTAPVRVERIFLASDNQTLVGAIACANISFHKLVVARFTLDYWKTTSEVVAEYNHDVRRKHKDDGYDRFNFNIKLSDQANLESKTLLLCVRYQVNGQEYWDNNNGMNYQVDFTRKTVKREHKRSTGSLGAIPRSRHSPLAPRPRSMPPIIDDDFGRDFERKLSFGRDRGDSPSSSIRLKPKNTRGGIFPDQVSSRSPVGQAFASRYDFGASLSAALSTAQTTLGDRSGLRLNTTGSGTQGYFDPRVSSSSTQAPMTGAPVPGTTRPDSLTSEKPDLQSAEYHELIQKFCFFGTPTGKASPAVTTPDSKAIHDSVVRDVTDDGPGSNTCSSAASSPASPAMPLLVDGAADHIPSHPASPFVPRSTSPAPLAGSPDQFSSSQYAYNFSMSPGIFYDRSHTPQACV